MSCLMKFRRSIRLLARRQAPCCYLENPGTEKMESERIGRIGPIHFNNSFVPFDKEEIEQSIPQRFEKQVTNHSKKLALKFKDIEFTYEDLNRFSNGIAHLILAERNAEQEPVALLLEEGPSMIGAILGILKSGKIYVVIDPSGPKSFIQDTLCDAQANLIITDNKNLSLANELATDRLRVLSIDAINYFSYSGDNPNISISPDASAYIFYTSGSTGRPKGVVDNHRNILHNIMRYTNNLKIAPEDRLTLLQACNFSGSVSSLFCALLNGATSYPFILKKEGAKRMASWLSDEQITIYHSVPSIFRLIATGERNYPALRIIRLEGDRCGPADIDLYKKYFSDSCILVNGLGATECGIVRQFFVDKTTPTPSTVVPIGYDIEDMRILLLDEAGQEVGPDSIGEIAVESQYLAQGYWHRPDTSRAAFLPHPHDINKRIYRTGDLGRFQPDGCLDYLGRKNFIPKIRGQWVEVGVIEKVLYESGYFKEVAVSTHGGDHLEPILVAYLVPKEIPAPASSAVRRYLTKRLPGHMVPTSYMFLDELPLDANGKVDLRALPPPTHAQPGAAAPFSPPENLLQIQLQRIWEEVLGIHPIGIRDDFFDLGGDSLQALIMLMMVEQEIDTVIPPEVLLPDPTIKALGDYIQSENKENKSPLVEIQKGGERGTFYFLHGDYMSGGFYCRRIARGLGPDWSFYAIPPCGLSAHLIPSSYQEMAGVHLKALRAHQPKGPYMLGGTCNGGLVAYEMARQLTAEGQKVTLLVLIAASARNVRYKFLKKLLLPLRLLIPNGANYESRAFARLHPFLTKLQRVPLRHYPKFIRSKIPLVIEEMKYFLKLLQDGGSKDSGEVLSQINRSSPVGIESQILTIYHQIDYEYMPAPYPGKVTLFWANGEEESAHEAMRWWRKIAGEVELHIMPGTPHQESITVHAEAVAEMLKSCLEGGGVRL
jgi:amino acid adenylation domain-containing protein